MESNVTIKGNLDNFNPLGKLNIQSNTVIHLGGMAWCEYAGYLEVGENGLFSPNCVIYATGKGGIKIGRNFDCGPGSGIFSSRTDYLKGVNHHIFEEIIIGDDVIFFANVVISPGVKIGNRVTVAANSVVTSNLPDNVLAGGNPAKIIKYL